MTPMQKKIEALVDQQNHIAVRMSKMAEAINAQAGLIKHHQNAIENIMEWLGEELGPEAVGRLREHLGVPEPEEGEATGTQSVICQ